MLSKSMGKNDERVILLINEESKNWRYFLFNDFRIQNPGWILAYISF